MQGVNSNEAHSTTIPFARLSADPHAVWKRSYRRTKRGFLSSTYSAMRARVLGQASAQHIYAGKALLPRNVFYMWAIADPEFNRLWTAYAGAGFQPLGDAPSIDRINPAQGYTLNNMRWLLQRHNAGLVNRAGERSGSAKLTEALVRQIRADKGTNRSLARKYGVSRSAIQAVCARTAWSHI